MVDDQHCDVIVIGTGAGGGTLAHKLAASGKSVLLLERGDYLPRERDNWDSTAVFVKGKYRAPEFWLSQGVPKQAMTMTEDGATSVPDPAPDGATRVRRSARRHLLAALVRVSW